METSKNSVTIIRTFPAGIGRLWKAFTTIEDMGKWWSPVGMTTTRVESDLRVGGEYAITMQYIETLESVTVRGEYLTIDQPTKLQFTWKWDGSEQNTEVTITFRSLSDEETEMTLIHAGFDMQPTESDIANRRTVADHKGGWTSAFTKLDAVVQNK